MCGISGYLDFNYSENEGKSLLKAMNNKLSHRGPDDCGMWLDTVNGIGFGHTRLSIVGHGKSGSQPMTSDSGRYVISFNGEIYNFKELRKKLKQVGKVFIGNSDTEVLLHGLEEWGLNKLLRNLSGMFAIAYFDKNERELILVRDRIGEKPIYFGYGKNGHIAFASEIIALSHIANSRSFVNPSAIANLVSYNYIPSPGSIFSNINKIEPGCVMKFSINGKGWVQTSRQLWWTYPGNNLGFDTPISKPGIKRELIEILEEVVSEQGEADVPVGSLLSGGVDSTLVTAIHQKIRRESVKTFTVAFSEKDFNESQYARDIAEKLGTEHKEVLLTPEEALDIIPKIAKTYGEPFADSSQIATMAVCAMASQYMSAVLTGDGADEVFGGYNRYIWAPRIWKWKGIIPLSFGHAISNLLLRTPHKRLKGFQVYLNNISKTPQITEKLFKVGWALNSKSKSELYHNLVTGNSGIEFVKNHSPSYLSENYEKLIEESKHMAMAMMEVDMNTYLPDDILVKVDRASMSFGLETRAPFIDRRVIEFMSRVPVEILMDKSKNKILLRELLEYYLPKNLLDRPKMGFSVPVGEWLRGPLREWAETLLSEERLEEDGFFNVAIVRKYWDEHLRGVIDGYRPLWSILIFQSWLESIDVN